MKNNGEWLQSRWLRLMGICYVLLGLIICIVLVGGSFLPFDETTQDIQGPSLDQFTIVAGADGMDAANDLSKSIQKKLDIQLEVVDAESFSGGNAIYVGIREFNSYNGYRYGISTEYSNESCQ